MGDWQTDWSRDALERIAALLFALAGLADRAAGVPFLRRRQVLEILSYGETEARAFVIGFATGAPAWTDAPDGTGDAAGLAIRLRALALVLCVLLARRAGLSVAPVPRAGRARPAGRAGRQGPPPASDTS